MWDTLDLGSAEVVRRFWFQTQKMLLSLVFKTETPTNKRRLLQLKELYTLLNENYVEDDDNMFRFDYSPNFLKW